MQITVDTDKDSPAVLSNVARFILMGYGTPAEIGALIAAQSAPAPAAPAKPDFLLSDDMPPSPIELGKDETDTKAAAVFGGAASVALAPLPVPPPPPVVSAVAVPPAQIPEPPGATAADVPRDSAGVPYDARIHNKARTMKQDGTWKLAKGVDPAIVTAVMAEIAPDSTPAPLALPAAPVAVPAVPVPPAPPAGSLPSVPSGPVQGPVTFREVMKKVTEGQASGKLTKLQVDTALGAVGFKPDELAPLVMPANVELLKAFNQLIDADLAKAA